MEILDPVIVVDDMNFAWLGIIAFGIFLLVVAIRPSIAISKTLKEKKGDPGVAALYKKTKILVVVACLFWGAGIVVAGIYLLQK